MLRLVTVSNKETLRLKKAAWLEEKKNIQLPQVLRVNPNIVDHGIYLNGNKGLYAFQQEQYAIDQILPENLEAYYERQREFLASPEGKRFQTYKIKKLRRLHGYDVWSVDEEAVRYGGREEEERDPRAAYVDFTMGGHGKRYLFIPTIPEQSPEIWVGNTLVNPWRTIWHEFIESRSMRRGMNYQDAHTKSSENEIRAGIGQDVILPVGAFRAPAPGYCGPSTLYTYLQFLGIDAPFEEINYLCKNTQEDGTDPEKMIEALAAYGLHGIDLRNMTVEQVKKFINAGYPIIVNWQDTPDLGGGHYSILNGYHVKNNEFIFSDSSEMSGHIHMNIPEFMSKWYELEDQTERQGIIVVVP